ncbi:protein nrt1/ ptr family 7.3 [Phtheirospermum japonicum]|uniref:Protein nrt1/ ptr family 7.3 n=1 Tax=Phtheirospermum japonicum TaxID=374723 RepID=A0A830BMM7_9LAMI|nr:protein nrt1/ ptr family 7.3 [Phtheirospermum japonicum]
MTSVFVEQGAAMENDLAGFKVPLASMSAFEIVSAAAFILIHRRLVDPIVARVKKSGGGLTEIERMGIDLAIAVMSMVGPNPQYPIRTIPRCPDFPISMHFMGEFSSGFARNSAFSSTSASS